MVDNFLFGKNSHQPKFVSTSSENVFCVFLNKEIRYWCNSNRFTVLLMWSMFWGQISFLGTNSHHPIFFTAGSETVFCIFLNKKIRYWCNSNRFTVLLMWSMFWRQISFLGTNSHHPIFFSLLALKMYFAFFSIRKSGTHIIQVDSWSCWCYLWFGDKFHFWE